MSYFAEMNDVNEVVRVVVAESLDWCVEQLGGRWVEVADPYNVNDDRVYPGPGYGYDDKHPALFAPIADRVDLVGESIVWHDGRIGRVDSKPELFDAPPVVDQRSSMKEHP